MMKRNEKETELKKQIDIKEIKKKHEALDYINGMADKAQEYKQKFCVRLKSKRQNSIINKK